MKWASTFSGNDKLVIDNITINREVYRINVVTSRLVATSVCQFLKVRCCKLVF
jgi:hypothetical protein